MIKTILIDLDETLLDFTRAEAAALERALTELGAPYSEAVRQRYHAINAIQWELLEDGVLTREEALVRRFALLLEELDHPADPAALCGHYESYLEAGHWLLPGAREVLEALTRRYAVCAASNGSSAVQRRRLEASGILPYFQDLFISEELGHDKPGPAFFEAAFARIPGFRREETVMVGDSLTSDIRGGRNAGIRTCWYNPKGLPARPDIRPDFQFSSLEALPALLETL